MPSRMSLCYHTHYRLDGAQQRLPTQAVGMQPQKYPHIGNWDFFWQLLWCMGAELPAAPRQGIPLTTSTIRRRSRITQFGPSNPHYHSIVADLYFPLKPFLLLSCWNLWPSYQHDWGHFWETKGVMMETMLYHWLRCTKIWGTETVGNIPISQVSIWV